jgi:purine-nucleoside phosphorylase
MVTYEQIEQAAAYIKNIIHDTYEIGIVLGSGLGSLADDIEDRIIIDYRDIPNFPVSTVEGHVGRFVYGKLCGKRIVAMQGRIHYYEGYDMEQVTMPQVVLKMIGVDKLLLTNAAGGISDSLNPGDLVAVSDHITSFVPTPLRNSYSTKLGPLFPDMTCVYDEEYREILKSCFEKVGCTYKQGVYLQTTGPAYETPAEIRMYGILGADMLGMSTACEAVVAHQMGMKVACISTISNKAAGLGEKLSHEKVIEACDVMSDKLKMVVKEFVKLV